VVELVMEETFITTSILLRIKKQGSLWEVTKQSWGGTPQGCRIIFGRLRNNLGEVLPKVAE
jgi:hypothetical protein